MRCSGRPPWGGASIIIASSGSTRRACCAASAASSTSTARELSSPPGLAWHPDGKRLLISYSVADSEAWIATVDSEDVRRLLEDISRLRSARPETGEQAAPDPLLWQAPQGTAAGPPVATAEHAGRGDRDKGEEDWAAMAGRDEASTHTAAAREGARPKSCSRAWRRSSAPPIRPRSDGGCRGPSMRGSRPC